MNADRLADDALNDILSAAEKAIQFVEGMTPDDLANDDRTEFAVIKALEIVGEAARRVPNSFRDSHPQIPWREMAAMRDKLVHDYFGVNLEVVWKTIHEDLPPLIAELQSLIEELQTTK
jgi:uncharacterized protein with HEPN domain